MIKLVQKYKVFVRGNIPGDTGAENSIDRSKDELFLNFLVYCFPISFIALIPGVYMALSDGLPAIAAIDLAAATLLVVATFANRMTLNTRKFLVIVLFYILALFLINTLGYVGPGIFYLFAITILIALIYPISYAYWSAFANMGILLAFAAVIRFHLFNSALARDYSSGGWLAFSSNLIFLSVVIVLLIQRIFQNLQRTIKNKDQLQEKYKSIFQLSPVPMWLFDPESLAFLDVNEAAINHYGYTREEFLAMTIRDIRMGSDVKKVEEVAKTNAVTGMYYNGRAEHIKKNGEKIYVNIESNLLDLDGNKARLVLANDITPQLLNRLEVVNANIKLKQSLINLSAIFESTANGIVLLDEHYNIKLFNLKAANYIKFSTGKLEFEIGRSIFDYIEVIRQAYLKTLFKKVYAGETIEFDRKYRRPNKLTYWIHYTITPVYEESTVKGFCIAGRDVTARKTYVKFVEEQNRVFREISWMQSHVVRAPLARIMGLAALLEHEKDEAEKAEILKHLDESSRELDGIIHDIVSKSANIVEKFPKD